MLMRSSLFGFIDIVEFLLKQENIQYNEKDMYNNTALIYAKTDEIEQLFLSNYGVLAKNNDLDITGFEAVKLNRAADHGNLERVKQFLAGQFFYLDAFFNSLQTSFCLFCTLHNYTLALLTKL